MVARAPFLAFTAAAFSLAARVTGAQTNPAPVRVGGVAYDSVRNAPLASAVITIVGTARTTVANSRGEFRFDSVAAGTYTFAAQHAEIDSIGFSGISVRAIVTDGRDEIRLAVPSFATLWRTACGNTRPPADSGFVYGTVRHATDQSLLPNALVDLTWLDLRITRSKEIREIYWRGQSRTDARGGYEICGVPISTGLRIRAITDSGASGLVDLLGNGRRVRRRDLLVGKVVDSVVARGGTIAGLVTDSIGTAISGARVSADGVEEIRTDSAGRFTARNVPLGTRQVEVLAIGMKPVTTVVDVMEGETASVLVTMTRVTTLDVIRVTASRRARRLLDDLDERRRSGFGYMKDSADMAHHPTLEGVFLEFPSARVEHGAAGQFSISFPSSRGGRCLANVVIDGVTADYERLEFIRPSEIAAIEVYPHRFSVPAQFLRSNECGAVIVWTKWMLH